MLLSAVDFMRVNPQLLLEELCQAARDCLSHLSPPVLTSPQEQAFCKPPCPLSAGIPEAESSVEKPDLVVVLEVLGCRLLTLLL